MWGEDMEVKNIIRNRRIELGMTMKEVAKAVGVSEATISRWESGDIENMRRDKIASLAKTLKLKPEIIMGWDNVPESGQGSEYYLDDDAMEIAQEVFENPEKRFLFKAIRGIPQDDIKLLSEMALRMKGTNPDG